MKSDNQSAFLTTKNGIEWLDKFKRPIDFLPAHPFQAIRQVWNTITLEYKLNELEFMFFMAISADECIYDDREHRAEFIEFYCDLIRLVEATYFLSQQRKKGKKWKKGTTVHRPIRISDFQSQNPIQKIKQVCGHYTLKYIEIQLEHFTEAVIAYNGHLVAAVIKENIVSLNSDLLCLWKAGCLISKE